MRLCAALLFATACTHHHPVTTLQPDASSTTAYAELDNGHRVEVRAVSTVAGLRWAAHRETSAGTEVLGAPLDPAHMRSFTTYHHGRGLAEGLALGALGGVVLGAAIGWASGDDHCSSEFCILQFSAGEKAAAGAILMGAFGAGLGGLIGGVVGSRYVYDIDTAYVPRASASVGPGHAGGGLSWSF